MTNFAAKKSSFANMRIARLLGTSALAAAGLVMMPGMAQAVDSLETPMGEQVVGGSASFDRPSEGQLNVNQNTDRVVINWDTFNIGQSATTQFYQPNSGSLAVNRVTGKNQNPTQILGTLKANGRVMVLDRNGVMHGEGSQIDVGGGYVASTGDLDTSAVMNGDTRLVLNNFGDGAIVNAGAINAGDAGLVALVGKSVSNSGVISAKMGRVSLASGDKATLDLYGDNLVELAVDTSMEKALVENSGSINAQGGTVHMTAAVAKTAVDNVVNMSGVINASSVTQKGGKIILSAGKANVTVSGKLDASGTSGGDIKVAGENVHITKTAEVRADAGNSGHGGTAFIYGNNIAAFEGVLSAKGGAQAGDGGDAEISGGEGVGFYGLADLSAVNGDNGTLLIDPRILNIGTAPTSGVIADIISGGTGTVNINDQALANTLRFTNVNLWATEKLNTTDNIDLSTWNMMGFSGITSNNLTVAAPEVNLIHDIVIGNGEFNVRDLPAGTSVLGLGIMNVPAGGVNVDVVNLDGIISTRSTLGGATSVAGDDQINSQANTVNVLSDNALIQQGVYLSNDDAKGTVNVAAGSYDGGVQIRKSVDLFAKGAGYSTVVNIPASGDGFNIANTEDVGIYDFSLTSNGVPGNQDAGIRVLNSKNIAMARNLISDAYYGINVNKAANVAIILNEVDGARKEGIAVNGVDGTKGAVSLLVARNNVHDGETGIRIRNSDYAEIVNNTVTNQRINGIHVSGSLSADVQNNIIANIGNDGIIADLASDDMLITGNNLSNVGNIAIKTVDLKGAVIGNTGDGNTVAGAKYGVHVEGGSNIFIKGNDIGGATKEGIYANGVDGTKGNIELLISRNNVHDGATGIRVRNSDYAEIVNNTIERQSLNGIHVSGSFSSDIQNSIINNIGNDGIIADLNSDQVFISDNKITRVGETGIRVLDALGATIGTDGAGFSNEIDRARYGVYVENARDVDIVNNSVNRANKEGIFVRGVDGTAGSPSLLVARNSITNGFTGIRIRNSDYAEILDNTVTGMRLNGMHVSGGVGSDIESNTLSDVRNIGMLIDLNTADSMIRDNRIFATGSDGIRAQNSDGIQILSNFIGSDVDGISKGAGNIGGNGVYLIDSENAVVADNSIQDAVQSGVYVSNNLKTASFSGNTVRNSNIGMTFESGLIDLTGATNFLFGGNVGYRFNPNAGNRVDLVNDTIGTTFFSGQTTYFVEALNGALFDPGSPTIENGLDATYDTPFGLLQPSSVGGNLTQAQYDYLEQFFQHYNDDPTVGLFFFGNAPITALIDNSDIFRDDLALDAVNLGRVNVTILGLPRLPGSTATLAAGATAPTTAQALSGLAPQAGGEPGDETVAVSGEAVQNIEPAAGEATTTTCWGDAIAAASEGQVVSYGFDANGGDALSALNACNNRT